MVFFLSIILLLLHTPLHNEYFLYLENNGLSFCIFCISFSFFCVSVLCSSASEVDTYIFPCITFLLNPIPGPGAFLFNQPSRLPYNISYHLGAVRLRLVLRFPSELRATPRYEAWFNFMIFFCCDTVSWRTHLTSSATMKFEHMHGGKPSFYPSPSMCGHGRHAKAHSALLSDIAPIDSCILINCHFYRCPLQIHQELSTPLVHFADSTCVLVGIESTIKGEITHNISKETGLSKRKSPARPSASKREKNPTMVGNMIGFTFSPVHQTTLPQDRKDGLPCQFPPPKASTLTWESPQLTGPLPKDFVSILISLTSPVIRCLLIGHGMCLKINLQAFQRCGAFRLSYLMILSSYKIFLLRPACFDCAPNASSQIFSVVKLGQPKSPTIHVDELPQELENSDEIRFLISPFARNLLHFGLQFHFYRLTDSGKLRSIAWISAERIGEGVYSLTAFWNKLFQPEASLPIIGQVSKFQIETKAHTHRFDLSHKFSPLQAYWLTYFSRDHTGLDLVQTSITTLGYWYFKDYRHRTYPFQPSGIVEILGIMPTRYIFPNWMVDTASARLERVT
ncbi:putative signal peptide protein [Puccinia sorghi]|uniref:Putative signal peptide protein n=1 Tax=Puccinia sorghi TaxID=27349 RepID=A0A0L6VTY6_9BASI|nr:putative signal peptide protein [Puccinia sorghi]